MKFNIIIANLIFLFLIDQSKAENPADLQRLIDQREQAIKRIDDVFIQELNRLKTKYTKEGNLDVANNIVNIINSISVDPEIPISENPSILGKWTFIHNSNKREFIFNKDNTFTGQFPVTGNTFHGNWKVHEGSIVIMPSGRTNNFGTITFDSNNAIYRMDSYQMIGKKGSR